ncbi:MAG TPA: DUF2141 domain-containing protein [Phenylobacterium sp.]|nr:DUF2141 domain-containing protein [Phenylobacterium sp.]
MLAKSLAAASVAALSLVASAAQASDTAPADEPQNVLRIAVAGVESTRGHVRVDVCPVNDFLKDCRYGGVAPATPGVTVVVVKDLPPGTYAAQAYQDGNDNHSVDRNILGLPTEGVGFSNNAPIRLHPPSFGAAAFDYAGGDQTISFKLRHFAN